MPAFGENLCCANHCKQSSGDEFSAESSRKHYAPDLIIQSRHIKICLNFNLSQYSLDARVIHTFHRIPSSFAAAKDDLQHLAKSIELNAVDFQNIRVKSLTADCPVSFEYTGKLLKLAWDKSFAGGEERQVEIAYSVVRPVAGMFFSHPKVSNESDSFVYAITDHETERARYWLPCVDYPSSRTTLEFELTCPKHMIALGMRVISTILEVNNT